MREGLEHPHARARQRHERLVLVDAVALGLVALQEHLQLPKKARHWMLGVGVGKARHGEGVGVGLCDYRRALNGWAGGRVGFE